MAIQPVPSMTTVPPFPSLADRAAGTYNIKAYTFGTHMAGTFNTELLAVANNVLNNATEAEASAATATTRAAEASASANAAAATAGAAMWVSGSYTTGQAAISPSNLQTYRRKAPGGTSPTDPASDSTNWEALGGVTATGAVTLANKSLQDSTTFIVDDSDATKKVQFQVSAVATGTTRTVSIPNKSGTMAMLDDIPAASPAGLTLIATATAANSATIDFTGINSTYDEYLIEVLNAIPTTNGNALYMRTSTNGGSSYDNGTANYKWVYQGHSAANTAANGAASSATEINLAALGIGTNANDVGASLSIHLIRPSVSQYCQIHWSGCIHDGSAELYTVQGAAMRLSANDVDAIRFQMSGSTIESGVFKLYGIRKTV